MKGTVPNHDQPVAMPNLDLDSGLDLDQSATGQTKQQVSHSGSYKVRTSVAFLGLAIASGILSNQANDYAVAAELSNPDPNPALQSSSAMTDASPNQVNTGSGEQASQSDWQPSLLRTVSRLNAGENVVNRSSQSPDVGLETSDRTDVEAVSTPESQPSVSSESLPQSVTLNESRTPSIGQIRPSHEVETSATQNSLDPSVQISETPTEATQELQPNHTAQGNSLDTLSQESAGAFVIPTDASNPTVAEVYQVGSGDTLDRIATLHNVSVDALIKANQLTDPNVLSVHQSLKIPKQLASSFSSSPSSPVTNSGPDSQIRLEASPSSQQLSSTTDLSALGGRLPQAVLPAVIPSELNSKGSSVTDFPKEAVATLSSIPTHSTLNQLSLNQLASRVVNGVESPTPVAAEAVSIPVEVEKSSLSQQMAVQQVSVRKSEAVNKLYSDRLRSEVERLREEYKAQSGYQVMNISLESGEESTVKTLTSVTTTSAHRQKRINPEFNPQGYSQQQKATQVEQNLSAQQLAQVSRNANRTPSTQLQPESRRSVVATAPIGAKAYDPLNNPTLGQMVSPQLPPLPGPDAYLPNGSMRFNGYIWPAAGILSSPYGWRWGRMHKGIDIAGPIGTPIFAAAPGVVTYAGWNDGGYGNLVEIEHPDGSLTVYAHNDRVLVNEGQKVAQGEQISEMGTTGRSTGPHLHFEIHPKGEGAVNPIAFLPPDSSMVSQNY
ncbi:putative lipoprotein YgeR [Planktothrix tepida]|uniref:LysM domain-containing protein n=2 Tax=Planktothrix TaxID=54304 RepID=A0A1J1LP52_9CYAN|nr:MULTISPECIES: peptidoglycan DD-metalloendopeptidase family protein [Planktothrix]CAD5934518.1 putative lipoprotein YgeR [Planktothrix pseudagardhii]CAD5975518.1 putative lipoprotein YgeR [Planktothrix tepida]CUR34275.1 conserved hypothetical protein [Planktothrix tepida PCC 9214]